MNIAQNVALSPVEIKALRKSLRLTQSELAEKLGYSRNYVTLVETGDKPSTLEFSDRIKALVEGANRQQGMSVREYPVGPDTSTSPAQLCRFPADCDLVQELASMRAERVKDRAERAEDRAEIKAMKTTLDTVVSLLGASLRITAPGEKTKTEKVG